MLFLTADKDRFITTRVRISLHPLPEEILQSNTRLAEENNDVSSTNASFQMLNLSILFVHGTKIVLGNPNHASSKQDDSLSTDPKIVCQRSLAVSMFEPKTLMRAMADSHGSKQCMMNFINSTYKSRGTSRHTIWQYDIKAKVVMEEQEG
ncbi:hypothetical protein Tco_0951590 [Tanacetum coccineum]|uniref:Uncharacterized protein n=1 Tax=Tanacetum coccineum TaxID=301880 RepID=A0ABQ5DUM3_9ASTR